MDGVLDPFADPVHCESRTDNQPDDLAARTSGTSRASWIHAVTAVWLVFGVYSDQRDREPGPKGCGHDTANQADQVDMSILLRHVNAGLEHQDAKGYTLDPADEADDREDREEEEDDTARVVLAREHVCTSSAAG